MVQKEQKGDNFMRYTAKKLPFRLRCCNCDGLWKSAQIVFGTVCPNNCKFCIAQQTADRPAVAWNQRPNIKKIIQAVKDVLVKNELDEVMITGGEPFQLIDDLEIFVDELRPLIKTIKIVTSLPKNLADNYERAKTIIKKIDELVVSVHSGKLNTWNSILCTNERHDRFKLLTDLSAEFGAKIKTNSVLSKQAFNGKDDIDRLIDKLIECGIKKISLNEVRGDHESYLDASTLMKLDLNSPFSHGCRIPIEIEGHADVECVFGKACFLTEPSQKASLADLGKTVIRSKYFPFRKLFVVPYLQNTYNIKPDGSVNVIDLR